MARLSLPTVLGVLLALHTATSTKLVCHMTNWAQYRPASGKFSADHIDPFLCTHVVYGLATINSFNQLIPTEWNDEEQYQMLNNLKDINPLLKTLLSVGGSTNGISPFIGMVSKPENRAVFMKSAISFLRKNNFDGLNLDWEFPGQSGSMGSDKDRFSDLAAELDEAFVQEAKDTKKTQLLLTANVAAFLPIINRAYDVPKIAPHLDFINVMTYDYHGHWEARTAHNSPLFKSSIDSGSHLQHNINSSISYWLSLGAPAAKLLLGFSTYGRTYSLRGSDNTLGALSTGAGEAGPYTRTAGLWSYYEVCSFINGASVHWIPEQKVPYATNGVVWVGYDNVQSFAAKVEWMNSKSLGGAHVWTLDLDDFSGVFCSEGAFPLVTNLRNSMGFPPKPTAPPRPTTTKDPIASFCEGRPDGLYENVADKTTYLQCFHGNTYVQRCQPGLIFYDSCKCCNYP